MLGLKNITFCVLKSMQKTLCNTVLNNGTGSYRNFMVASTQLVEHTKEDVITTPKKKFNYRDYPYKIVRPDGQFRRMNKLHPTIPRPYYVMSGVVRDTKDTDVPEKQTDETLVHMRRACEIARKVLDHTGSFAKVGTSTAELDNIAHEYCTELGAYPSPLLYKGYLKSICTSVNNVVCHGVPDGRKLVNGDIINIDVTVFFEGYHGDVAETYLVGEVDDAGKKLVQVAKQVCDAGIAVCKAGVPFCEIGNTIGALAESEGFAVHPNILGHGIGTVFHGVPDIIHVPNDFPGKMEEGMTFTIEPTVTEGDTEYSKFSDGWTIVSQDGSRTAMFENTILITRDGAEILTAAPS